MSTGHHSIYSSSEGASLGEQLVIAPTAEHHTATVIFLHGLGQSVQNWQPFIYDLARTLPDVKWILPQAPANPVTMNGGQRRPSWFDMFHLPPCVSCGVPGCEDSIARIEQIILSEMHTLSQPKKVVVAGFSQGAALSLLLALTSLHDLGGVASLAGWIPHKHRQQMAQFEPDLSVFWGHGIADEEVPLDMAEECIKFLQDGLKFPEDRITMKTYDGLGHSVCEQETADFAQWLARTLS